MLLSPLTSFLHKVLILHMVLLFMGFFNNITTANARGLL